MLGNNAPGTLGHNNSKQKIQYHLRLKQVSVVNAPLCVLSLGINTSAMDVILRASD